MTTKVNNRMIEGARISVRDYGAIGDGVADDTIAIQAAIDVAGSYDSVLFPSGTYRVEGQLVVSVAGVQFKGAGRQVTRLRLEYDGVDLGCIKIRHSQFTCSDMVLQGNSDITEKGIDTTQRAIHLVADLNSNHIDSWLGNVGFEYFNVCVHQEGRNVNIDNCLFSNSHIGILASNVTDARGLNVSSSCRFHSMTKTGETTGACIWIAGNANFHDLIVNRPYADDCYLFFYGFASGTSMSVHSDRARGGCLQVTDVGHGVNNFRRNFHISNTLHSQWFNLTDAKSGISIGGSANYDCLLTNVQISGSSGHGIFIDKAYVALDGIRIDDCSLATDAAYDGIHFGASAGTFTAGDIRISEGISGSGSNYMRSGLRINATGTFTSKVDLVNMQNAQPIFLSAGVRIFGDYPAINYPRNTYYSTDPVAEFNGQTVGTGDLFFRIGGGVTAEAGYQVTTAGVIGSTATLTRFGIRY